MRNLWIALVAAGLSAGAAAGLGAQAHAGHAHDLADGMELHQGDLLWYRGEREIGRNQVIEGDVVVAGASLTVRGEVHGDAVVGGGDLVLESGAVIYGDAVVTGGKLVNRGGSVLGKVQEGGPTRRADGTNAIHVKPGLITGLGAGWAGLVGTLVLGVVLCALGGALAVYGRPYLEQASDVIRRAPLDAATVGLSANVLALPVFLGGALALTLTLVGIPFLLVFVPLFWTAVIVLAAAGTVATAHAVGSRAAARRAAGRSGGAAGYLLTGVALLLAPLAISHLLGVTSFTGWVAGVVNAVSWTLLWLAASVGAGAVMIVAVRAWRDHEYRQAAVVGGMDDLGTGTPRV